MSVRLGSLRQRGSPGVSEEQLALGSGLRTFCFTCTSSGYPTVHTYNTPATLNSMDRCVLTSPLTRTWVPDTWHSVIPGGTGFRNPVLPFPATPCFTFEAGAAAGKTIRARLTGIGQFGEPLVEESTALPLASTGLTLLNIYRIWFSKVFSRINKVEWYLTGAAPVVDVANVYVGLWFLWNTLAVSNTVAAAATATEWRLFPANAGIGTRMRLAQVQGQPTNRYPEIQVVVRTPTGGAAGTANVPPHATAGAVNAAGFYMGFTGAQHWIQTDTNTALPYSVWGGDPYKFRIESVRGSVDIKALDESSFLLYEDESGATALFDNPHTLIYDVTIRSLAGVKSPSLQVSVNGFS